ncbi:MAG: hypothetical protein WCF20_09055 [Methylovirgula sp.]
MKVHAFATFDSPIALPRQKRSTLKKKVAVNGALLGGLAREMTNITEAGFQEGSAMA